VDDDGQVHLPGQGQLRPEGLPLMGLPVRLLDPVIIQADLADGNDFWVPVILSRGRIFQIFGTFGKDQAS
jgi:hypothetical protein